jgi:hypothetical protein
LSNSYALRLC